MRRLGLSVSQNPEADKFLDPGGRSGLIVDGNEHINHTIKIYSERIVDFIKPIVPLRSR